MPVSRSAAVRIGRYPRSFRPSAVPTAKAAFTPRSEAEALAQRLCIELQALTGNACSSVLLDVLLQRLRVGLRELEPALACAARSEWIERHGDTVALREEGRSATLISWPPVEPRPPSQARMRIR
jgi:hypothetical protein